MKKRIQITESDRQSILRLHEEYKMSLLSEEASTERWKTATCADLKKGSRCKDIVLKVQIKINDTCPTDKLPIKLVEDGILGPKTSSAFTACGGVISAQGGSTTTGGTQDAGTSGISGTAGTSGTASTAGTSGISGTAGAPAVTIPAGTEPQDVTVY